MSKVSEFLAADLVQYLATVGRDGKAVFEDDKEIETAVLENPIVKNNYQTPDDPNFKVFYLEGAHAATADFSGDPPQKFDL